MLFLRAGIRNEGKIPVFWKRLDFVITLQYNNGIGECISKNEFQARGENDRNFKGSHNESAKIVPKNVRPQVGPTEILPCRCYQRI